MRFLRGAGWAALGLACGLGLALLAADVKAAVGNGFVAAAADLCVDVLPVLGLAAGLIVALSAGRKPPEPPPGN